MKLILRSVRRVVGALCLGTSLEGPMEVDIFCQIQCWRAPAHWTRSRAAPRLSPMLRIADFGARSCHYGLLEPTVFNPTNGLKHYLTQEVFPKQTRSKHKNHVFLSANRILRCFYYLYTLILRSIGPHGDQNTKISNFQTMTFLIRSWG